MDEFAGRCGRFGEVVRFDYKNTYDRWHRGALPSGGQNPRAIAASWTKWHPDVIHINKQNLEDGLDLLPAAGLAGIPHLCTIHITQSAGFLGARFSMLRDLLARRALRQFRGPLVAVAPVRAAALSSFLQSRGDVRFILNGVAPSPADDHARAARRLREEIPEGSIAVVAVGRLEAQKSPLRFLEYAERILRVEPRAVFRWFGGGRMEPEWDRMVACRGLGSAVSRIAWRNDVRAVLPAYDLFLHSAAFEGLSLAILEAMDAALPCAIEQPVHGQLPVDLQACAIPASDATDWAELLRDRKHLAELGQAARATVRTAYSTTAMARAYAELYRELCPIR